MDAKRILNVADARRRARRTLPAVVFDYIDGAADDEVTVTANAEALRRVAFRPRMANGRIEPDLSCEVLGTPLALPVLLAPCGLVGMMHPDGAVGVARAAARHGTVSVLSTVAGTAPGVVAERAPGPKWFQLYAPHGPERAAPLVERAAASGYEALVVTVDTPELGNRERDVRNGARNPLRMDARAVAKLGPQILARPGWAVRMARHTRRERAAAGIASGSATAARGAAAPTVRSATDAGAGHAASNAVPAGAVGAAGTVAMLASPFSWSDVSWLRGRWDRSLVVKGLLSGDDAARAADAGADAVVVSNHGGRQLDGAPATIDVLPEVVDAVGDRVTVLVDGGIRRGGDVVKALALGASAVMVGRAYLYGLAAAGEAGVDRILDILSGEMVRTMRLLGCASVADLDRSWLQAPPA